MYDDQQQDYQSLQQSSPYLESSPEFYAGLNESKYIPPTHYKNSTGSNGIYSRVPRYASGAGDNYNEFSSYETGGQFQQVPGSTNSSSTSSNQQSGSGDWNISPHHSQHPDFHPAHHHSSIPHPHHGHHHPNNFMSPLGLEKLGINSYSMLQNNNNNNGLNGSLCGTLLPAGLGANGQPCFTGSGPIQVIVRKVKDFVQFLQFLCLPVMAVLTRTSHRQIMPRLHLVDWRRMGVQAD